MPRKTTDELIEELALSVARGFDETHRRIRDLRDDVNDKMADLAARLDRIEFLANGQERRISVLEDRVRQLSTKVGLQPN